MTLAIGPHGPTPRELRTILLHHLRTLCAVLRRARQDGLDLAAWAVANDDIDNLIAACRCREQAGVIAWLGKVCGIDLFLCDCCECWRDRDKSTRLGDSQVCQHCRETHSACDDCDTLVHDDDGRSVSNGTRFCCESCANQYVTCCCCDIESDRDSMNRRDGDWYCDDHLPGDDDDEEEDDGDGIRSHETNVLDVFDDARWLAAPGENTDQNGNGKSTIPTLWMGFELEVIPNRDRYDAANAVRGALGGRGILKNDGSLAQGGFEIVSLPATLAYHQTGWGPGFFATLAAHVRGWREPTCGMHVHMARDALTPLQIARLQVFVNGDGLAINNRRFIEKVAGRGATEYCREYNKTLTDCAPVVTPHTPSEPPNFASGCSCPSCVIQREAYERALEASRGTAAMLHGLRDLRRSHDGRLARACRDRRNQDRYQAINLQPDDTIEFRIFQANVAPLGFLKNLEFCHAAVKFCADAGNTALHSDNFLDWMNRRRGEYPNFVRWAVRESLMARRHADAPGAAQPQIAA